MVLKFLRPKSDGIILETLFDDPQKLRKFLLKNIKNLELEISNNRIAIHHNSIEFGRNNPNFTEVDASQYSKDSIFDNSENMIVKNPLANDPFKNVLLTMISFKEAGWEFDGSNMDVEKTIYEAAIVVKNDDADWDKIQGYLHGKPVQISESTIIISKDS